MYLLILSARTGGLPVIIDLHSIMYLLIPLVSAITISSASSFTFHNVSINSSILVYKDPKTGEFTFHNVSINS